MYKNNPVRAEMAHTGSRTDNENGGEGGAVYWRDFLLTDLHGHLWTLRLAATVRGLCWIGLPGKPAGSLERFAAARLPSHRLQPDTERLQTFADDMAEYFLGRLKRFTCALDLRGTPFQVAVWRSLLEIPFGCTASYSDIAMAVGRPRATRAVGAANGMNPVPIIVPCHRVIGKDGSLTGYSGGLDIKRRLIAIETDASHTIQT